MAAGDGNGWVDCELGHRHWGRFGAAGLLVRHAELDLVLLQRRIEWSHEGGTWAVPGGARDSGESARAAAVREAVEELGIDERLLDLGGEYVDDHGTWSYTTVLASVTAAPEALNARAVRETADVAWVPADAVADRMLHSGFAATWPAVLRMSYAESGAAGASAAGARAAGARAAEDSAAGNSAAGNSAAGTAATGGRDRRGDG